MNYLPIIGFVVIVLGLLAFSGRARRKQAEAQVARSAAIVVGAEVMTTSGLYGTVVSHDEDDDTVLLSIAPGVEVKWAFAALRDIASLPNQYRPAEADKARPDEAAAGNADSADNGGTTAS
ncbi:preprotein translocase subunit YajC [uncultured Jatrophihabitans sp.]|uniref:preprotein translocase subunit YajC n=1 Tax=uncultured Jatrophihabitans sp. TaxID=1610747 RepID=UPI0035CAFB1E